MTYTKRLKNKKFWVVVNFETTLKVVGLVKLGKSCFVRAKYKTGFLFALVVSIYMDCFW